MKNFDNIVLDKDNNLFKEKFIDIYTNNGSWVNNEAQYLFDASSKECFIRKYYVNCEGLKPLKVANKNVNNIKTRKFDFKKKIFFINKCKDVKFSIDKVQVWLMRSGNGFVTYELSIVNCFNNKKKEYPISDEMCYNFIYRLKRSDKFFCYQNISKDNTEKFYFNCRHFIKEILENNNFEALEIDKTKTLLLNYVVTNDIESGEAKYFLYNIDRDLNIEKYECKDKKSIDENKVYYNKDYYNEYKNKWLATATSITMLGDSDNEKLVKESGIMQNVFEKHLFLFLYYENLSMICDKVEKECKNAGVRETICAGKFKTYYDWLIDLLKIENIEKKEEFLKQINKEDENNYFKYLFNKEENFIGGIAYDNDGKAEQLNMVYAYYYALKNKNNINGRIGRIIERHDDTKTKVRDGVIKYGKAGVEVAKFVADRFIPQL